MKDSLSALSIVKARELLERKEASSVELAEACLSEAERRNPSINAYLEIFDDVRAQAAAADEKLAAGEGEALTGIPLAIKDNILIKGRRVSAASKMLETYAATYDATVITKLKDESAVFMGRTNMDEFAMGTSTENSAFGATRNPCDEERVPGGSSGGSAAAVAMGGALAALGSDTGGSVRGPASFCGLVGLKPTYGSVSRFGLIAMGSSLDQIGPLARSVSDAELIFNAIRGRDPKDSTSIAADAYPKREAPKRIGVPRGMMEEGADSDVKASFERALKKMEAADFDLVDIELPLTRKALPSYYIIMPAEVSTNLARFDGVRYGLRVEGNTLLEEYAKTRGGGFGPEVRRRIILGTYVLSAGYYDAYYGKATALRARLRQEYEEAFQRVDLIATPTTPTPAFKIGEKKDPLSMYLEDIFTVTANLTGAPALSVPMGVASRDGKELPLGLHLTAPHGAEQSLFAAGKAFKDEIQ